MEVKHEIDALCLANLSWTNEGCKSHLREIAFFFLFDISSLDKNPSYNMRNEHISIKERVSTRGLYRFYETQSTTIMMKSLESKQKAPFG